MWSNILTLPPEAHHFLLVNKCQPSHITNKVLIRGNLKRTLKAATNSLYWATTGGEAVTVTHEALLIVEADC